MTEILQIIIIILSAIILHEYAHGWAAYRLGDPTAKEAGRLTLNPLKHIDPLGTIILPGVLLFLRSMGHSLPVFGWAKPVPVNFLRLGNPKRDMMWVGLAGPAVNIVLAIIFSELLKSKTFVFDREILQFAVFFNLLLATFNMIPIPPLDGSRLVMSLLPNRYVLQYARFEGYGILVVIVLLNFGLFDHIILPVVVWLGNLLGVAFT